MFCLCLRLLLCLSVSGCLCICLCRCPCVYLTALLSVPLSLPLSLSVTVPAPVSAHAAATPGDGTYHVLPAPLLCFHRPVWFPPFSTCRRHPECPRRSRWEIPTFSVQASFETGNGPKRVQYGAEMEPPRLPETLRRRPGRQSAVFGICGGAWALYGEVSGTPPGAPRDASGAFRGAPRTLLETFFEFSAEKTAFLKIELPPAREHRF